MTQILIRCQMLLFVAVTALMATTVNVPGIRPNYTANGADLVGLKVTIVWNFGATGYPPGLNSYSYTWVATGPDSGATNDSPPAHFPNFLALSGDSASSSFVFSGYFADPVVSITLDGTSAGILFDRALPSPGTPGTGTGNDAIINGIFTAAYSNPVGVAGAAPAGDLYSTMQFSIPENYYGPVTFRQTTVLATPEPSGFILTTTAIGLMVIRLLRRS